MATKIEGYRVLTEEEIELVNDIKAGGDDVGKLVQALRSSEKFDQRWVSIAETHLQQGFMALVRSVTRPKNF